MHSGQMQIASAAPILFPLGVRLSTWIGLAVFISFAAVHRDKRFLIAGLVWMTGFEATYDISSFIVAPSHWSKNALFFVISVFTLFWFRHAVKPDWRLMGFSAAIWIAWVATGFHVNSHTMSHFNAGTEALNEAAKTLWAAAYLWPLWKMSHRSSLDEAGSDCRGISTSTTPDAAATLMPDSVAASSASR
jgi:hypothetical protein